MTYEHIFLPSSVVTKANYKASSAPFKPKFPVRDRPSHVESLLNKFDLIRKKIQEDAANPSPLTLRDKQGSYWQFASKEGFDLQFGSLESKRNGIRLVNVRAREDDSESTIATVFVPTGKEQFLQKKLTDYRDSLAPDAKRLRNTAFVDSIEEIGLALMKSLWLDKPERLPQTVPQWIEVWIRLEDISMNDAFEEFSLLTSELGLEIKSETLEFPERGVFLVKADEKGLLSLFENYPYLAELRLVQEAVGFFHDLTWKEQEDATNDLLKRIVHDDKNVSVAVLDGGVNNSNPLLKKFLDEAHRLTHQSSWGVNDQSGHGSQMAGLVVYGFLHEHLQTSDSVVINHRLASVKILPPTGVAPNPKELWGAITQQAVSRVEIALTDYRNIFCMAITSPEDTTDGKPSSWSAAVDVVCFGDEYGGRLFFISGGNVKREYWPQYPTSNLEQSIENPAQSWNALTIGSYTTKAGIYLGLPQDHIPLAQLDELSPYSRTSSNWDNVWPIKPEIIFEGGNLTRDKKGNVENTHDDLNLLTTSSQDIGNLYALIWATSASTALAANFAAKIAAKYPSAWPETIRGLMVHSATWPSGLLKQFNINLGTRSDVKRVLRIAGYGVPNEAKALSSTSSYMTCISQQNIQPFEKIKSTYPIKDIHYYDLPWPKEILLGLGEIQVTLRVTLSYFIEPNPSERSYNNKFRYQSFGLRFDLSNSGDTQSAFRARINIAARTEEEDVTDGDSGRWLIGAKQRSRGSILTDSISIEAAKLADCNMLAVYPTGGWWKERIALGRFDQEVRYSLIVSLETPEESQDIYQAVTTQIITPIPVK